MSEVLAVQNLYKFRPNGFQLNDVSFTLEEGRILGFIGRAGAGKTTALMAITGLIRPDAGGIRVFGLNFAENERTVKQRMGISIAPSHPYGKKKISEIIAATRPFYDTWDEEEHRKYMARFDLDPAKKPEQLTAGGRIRLQLALAMSHRARLLILDAPTDNLDPVSGDDLADIFWYLRKQGVAILLATGSPAVVEKCCDDLVYIRGGRVIEAEPLADFIAFHRHMGAGDKLEGIIESYEKGGYTSREAWEKELLGADGQDGTDGEEAEEHPETVGQPAE